MLLNHFKIESLLRYLLNCNLSIISEYTFFTICLFTFPSSFFVMDLLKDTFNSNKSCLCRLCVSRKQVLRTFLVLNQRSFHSCSDLIPFKNDLSDMVTSLTFRGVRDSFQCRWNKDIRKKKSSRYVFVSAYKTNNIYKMSKDHHEKLLRGNFTYQASNKRYSWTNCTNSCFRDTQRPQRKLLLQFNASFNESIENVSTRKSE